MDELQAILNLKRLAKERLAQAQEELRALEVVERMISDRAQPNSSTHIPPKLYKAMTQHEAIQDVLEKAGGPLTAAAIADRLERGGYPFTSQDPKGPIYAALKKDTNTAHPRYFSKKSGTGVVFGLAKWEQAEIAVAS